MEKEGQRGLKVKLHRFLHDAWPHQYQTPTEKGYPEVFDLMSHWVLTYNDIPIGYTGSLDMGHFHFVGNTYILPEYRQSGWHSYLLSVRNANLGLRPKITVLNPIDGTHMANLVKVVSKLGYTPVLSYDDVSDVMSEKLYDEIRNENQQLWRMD
ncbi:MAG: hypothetical protein CL536_00915 [Alcaligenaceae bacterium]|nr:hypothetical protein [Alcaligenaceae bacterium]